MRGAVVKLEQLLGKELASFHCRHHSDEIILKGAFELKMPASISPNIELFKRFKGAWA